MPITRYRPLRDMDQPTTPRTFTSILDEFFNDVTAGDGGGLHTPGMDVSETDSHYHVQVALPGMKKEDINIDLQDRRLTISGERKEETEDKEKKHHVRETRYGKFERSVMLPENINPDNIDARFEDGILKMDVEKKEKQTGRKIDVK